MAIAETELPGMEKRPWTDGAACRDRPVHCAYCPYVFARPVEYADVEWLFPIKDVYCKEDGTLVKPGLENSFTPPPLRRCPWGETFDGAREACAERTVQRVADGKITAQQAIDSLTALGIDVDLEVAEP